MSSVHRNKALPGDATWIHTFADSVPPQLWTNVGGDFSMVTRDSVTVSAPGPYTWGSTDSVVADVQSWLDDPAGNFGWIVVGGEGQNQTAKRFDTHENSVAANRPKLTITYTAP